MRGYAICRVILCTYIACLTIGIVGCSDSDGPVKTPIATPLIAPTGQFPHLPTAPSANPFGTIDFNNEDATQNFGDEDDEDGAESDDDVTVNKSVDAAAPAACDAFVHCGNGYACVSGVCVVDTAPPAPVETSTAEAGTIPPTFISPPASLGEDCSQDTTHCSEDFLCQPCATGLVCNGKHQCALPSDGDKGDSCTSPAGTADESLCGPGLTCAESLTTTGATEHRCAKYLSEGSGGFCNPDAGLLCNASKNLICVQNPDINPATLTNLAEFGWCAKQHPGQSLGEQCIAGTVADCAAGLICSTAVGAGGTGLCINTCARYAKEPDAHTVALVVELYQHKNFAGTRAVIVDSLVRVSSTHPLLVKNLDQHVGSIRVYKGPNYIDGDKVQLFDNLTGTGESVFEAGPGEYPDFSTTVISKTTTCATTLTALWGKWCLDQETKTITLQNSIRSVRIARGVLVPDFCADVATPTDTWQWPDPIWIVATLHTTGDTATAQRMHAIRSIKDLSWYQFEKAIEKITVQTGPDYPALLTTGTALFLQPGFGAQITAPAILPTGTYTAQKIPALSQVQSLQIVKPYNMYE